MKSTLSRGISHILNSWKHHGPLQFATILVLTVSFTVILGVTVVTQNLQNILTLWGDSLQMSVFISDTATDEKVASLNKFLKSKKEIEQAKFVSSEDALHDFKEQMASFAPGLLSDGELIKFIPKSFQLSFANSLDSGNQISFMKNIANEIKSFDGVDDVSYGQDWVKNYSIITKIIQMVGYILISVTGFGGLFVISNSLRASISQRRNEIEVLELIGASQKYIRTPFIIEGALLGLGSSMSAVLVCYALYLWGQGMLQKQLSFLQLSEHIQFMSFSNCVFACIAGALLGGISAWLCVRKINNGWSAAFKFADGEQ
jgi:cell division transport system permease protein